MKIIGISLLVVSSVAVGRGMALRVKLRIEELIYIKKLMSMFRGEISYKNAMLSDGFMAVAMKAKAPYNRLFEELSEETECNYSQPMAELFERKIDQVLTGNTYLGKEDLSRLKELGETMGYQDRNMQIANVDLYIDRLSSAIEEDKGKMHETMKVYRTLGTMAGVMAAIVFI